MRGANGPVRWRNGVVMRTDDALTPFRDLPGPRGLPLIGVLHRIRLDRLHLQLEAWAASHGALFRLPMSADTALRLARYFGTTPQLWLNLQKTWELRRAEIAAGREIAKRIALCQCGAEVRERVRKASERCQRRNKTRPVVM